MVDRVASAKPYRDLLLALGVTPTAARQVQLREQLSAFGVICGASLGAGVLISLGWARLDAAAAYPLTGVAALAASTALLGAAVVYVGVATSAQRKDG